MKLEELETKDLLKITKSMFWILKHIQTYQTYRTWKEEKDLYKLCLPNIGSFIEETPIKVLQPPNTSVFLLTNDKEGEEVNNG